MPSFKTVFLSVATALVGTVRADYFIDPSSVPRTTRESWCRDERSACPLICMDQSGTGAQVNTCDPETLTYGCLCGDNTQPNVSEYSLTLPYFVCTEWGNQCEKGCGSDSTCASACRQDHPCGASHPRTANTTSTATSTASATSSSSAADETTVFNGPAGSSGSSSSSSSGAAVARSLETASMYAVSGTLGVLFVGFAYLL
ncbi:hypothetical protein KVR01_006517 [Diaporthe batatas]|uniref:uncharacterized protein n=1 Tax=Diaporthe batatas TaxID=748121 RepID=UPI001D0497C6|nr:uncharacterized protein KVR01_006517 [Diaporthe batatas]KAG8163220.1 hypothetical protein KVR01_006517 [Diaporthe batatas]